MYDLSEVDDSLKFILFFFTVKIPGTEARRSAAGPFAVAVRPIFRQ